MPVEKFRGGVNAITSAIVAVQYVRIIRKAHLLSYVTAYKEHVYEVLNAAEIARRRTSLSPYQRAFACYTELIFHKVVMQGM